MLKMSEINDIVNSHKDVGPGFKPDLQQGWLFVDAVQELHTLLRPSFEKLIQQSGPSFSVLAAGQLTARAVAITRGIAVLDRAEEISMATSNLRTAEENVSNLFYILYAGPSDEGRTANDLAEQFLAYRDVDHARMVNKSRAEYAGKYMKRNFPPRGWAGPRTLADFEAHCDKVLADSAQTQVRFPKMSRKSWHQLNKEERTQKVLAALPAFAEPMWELWTSIAGSTTIHNMLLHAGPMLFQKDVQKIKTGHVLEVEPTSDAPNQSVIAARFAELCWLSLGNLLGELPQVEQELQRLKAIALKKLIEKHRVPAVWILPTEPGPISVPE
ncbi:MAG: hypothetical protein EON58_04685, partial [Alphaproteobacteria bacterium]